MIGMATRRSRRDARALRFLVLLLGGWMLVRVLAHWDPAVPSPPAGLPPAPWAPEAPPPWAAAPIIVPDRVHDEPPPLAATMWMAAPPRRIADRPSAEPASGGWGGSGRHSLRLALMAHLLAPRPGALPAVPTGRSGWITAAEPGAAPPGQGQPYWMQRQLAGWSLGGWAYVRGGSGSPPGGIAAAGQLGGSQAGARLAYGFGDSGRLRAYGRATLALTEPRQRELAFGFAFAPIAALPVDVAVEQRVAVGSQGRTALAVMATGGVGDVALPGRFRLEAYAQAGIVGANRRDGFADAAVVVDREVARGRDASVHLGGLAAGSVQPGAARVDVGPRLTVRLPQVGEGSRVALDWRQRVAGGARPESGLALTLAADF